MDGRAPVLLMDGSGCKFIGLGMNLRSLLTSRAYVHTISQLWRLVG
jgi:hypothetical protein